MKPPFSTTRRAYIALCTRSRKRWTRCTRPGKRDSRMRGGLAAIRRSHPYTVNQSSNVCTPKKPRRSPRPVPTDSTKTVGRRETTPGWSTFVNDLLLADISAVAAFQIAENDGGKNREGTEGEERFMDAVDHLGLVGADTIGNEKRGGQAGGSDAKTDGHLLHGAGDGTGVACLRIGDIGIYERVHAGVLQRSEGAVAEGLQDNHPNGRVQ